MPDDNPVSLLRTHKGTNWETHRGELNTWANAVNAELASLGMGEGAVTVIDDTDSPYDVLAADRTIYCDTGVGAIQVNLPASAAEGRKLTIVRDGGSAVTLDGDGDERINGATTYVLATDNDAVDVIDTGVAADEWSLVGASVPALAAVIAAAALNTTHRTSVGTDHANVVLNDAHRAGDGSDHADVAANTAANALDLAHRTGDGSDHSAVALLLYPVWSMGVFGPWAFDGDAAHVNGAGLCGVKPRLTEAAAQQAKVEDGGVFADLSAGPNAGYTNNYQLFPDVPVAETDYAYFGQALPFCEIAFDMATVATFDAAGVLEWFYWAGAAWSALTIAHDGTSASTDGGSLAFGRDGAIAFMPPADWGQANVDGANIYWVRCGIAAGKAANLTAIPVTNGVNHKFVTPSDGFLCPGDGTITAIRLNDAAATLHGGAAVKFILMNYTTGEHSGELTFDQDLRVDYWSGLTLAVLTGDELGVLCLVEDGTNEPTNVMLELTLS